MCYPIKKNNRTNHSSQSPDFFFFFFFRRTSSCCYHQNQQHIEDPTTVKNYSRKDTEVSCPFCAIDRFFSLLLFVCQS